MSSVKRYAWEGGHGMRELPSGAVLHPDVTHEWMLADDYDRDIAALQGDKTALMSTIETIDIEAKGRIALARQSVVAQDHKIGEQEATITALKRTIDAQLDRLKSCSVRSTTIHRSVTEE